MKPSCSLWLFLFAVPAWAVTIQIDCGGVNVGVVDVVVANHSGRWGVSGGFATPLGSLAAAAAACGEDHFNWYQRVVEDNMPPVDSAGNRLVPPYDDPPPGGYGNDPNTGDDETQWADDFPWYWDEGPDPPPGTPGFQDGYHRLDNQPTGSLLKFEDFPGGPDGLSLRFHVALVSLNADNSLHATYGGFDWIYTDPLGRVGPSSEIVPEPAGLALFGFVLFAALKARQRARGTMENICTHGTTSTSTTI